MFVLTDVSRNLDMDWIENSCAINISIKASINIIKYAVPLLVVYCHTKLNYNSSLFDSRNFQKIYCISIALVFSPQKYGFY